MDIICTTYDNNLYMQHDGKIKRVSLKNARNIDYRFLKNDGVEVCIETTEKNVKFTDDKVIITLNDNDVSEYWYGEW